MNHTEFSNEFDILYNNIMSNQAPGLSEYEKSVFLTKAQEEIVKNYLNPKGNKYGEGLDDSLKRQIDFSGLIKVSNGIPKGSGLTIDNRSKLYDLPNDLFVLINETINTNTGQKQVVPISYTEYTRLMSKPFKEPFKNQAWRLIGTSNSTVSVEIITNSNESITSYVIRYIRRPSPIITTNLYPDYIDLTINGISTISECELNPIIHQDILQRAVELAKAAYEADTKAMFEVGQRSE